MVFTAAQRNAFFTDRAQMGIVARTRGQLQTEGITNVEDLAEFTKEALKQIAENLRRPTGRKPHPDAGQPRGPAPGTTIPIPPFTLGAKLFMRLVAASDLLRYYVTVGRVPGAGNMQWNPVGRNFKEQWKALTDRKEDEQPETPKITKALPVMKWTESFQDFLSRVVGVRTIPLSYVIRTDVDVDPAVAPPIGAGKPHADTYESLEAELVARASHDHPLYRKDNAQVYYLIEEATRTTSYAASIKPFQRRKNGRAAWLAIVNQYVGEDKWRAKWKRQDDLLHNRCWKETSNYSLDQFIASHRNAYVSMSQCVKHVTYQLPNKMTRVTYLLDSIECDYAPL